LGAFGEPLQNMINAYAYGDIWSRPARCLPLLGFLTARRRPS
jgi:hypothetical protein